MYNTCKQKDYVGYNSYPIKHILNRNMYRFMIQYMPTRKINITKPENYLLQFQLVYICYSHLCIHEQMRNAVLDLHENHFYPKTMSMIAQYVKFSISRMLSVIMIYEELKSSKYSVLSSLNFAPHLNYSALVYLSVLHKTMDTY